ncbi:hypothetical protein [Candidatus Odyssella acanthamoebae]|uniref:Polymerase nucleotidyl transferase domain-containing protein n=1 Tax=Candidatus Odyssella acanthamoebae TaxID=91604 RepID=A0A077AU58_9PROT|nr:hypothetical protein [Candidatus Paracaedibacter acanthamoebae]AIK96727.1 hypothetical protein ID47_08345 [Candidatus Paracaedibacter acanthamoebae]
MTKGMCINDQEMTAIKNRFKELFCDSDPLWLFGSRVNLDDHGGDIDLFIDTSILKELAIFWHSLRPKILTLLNTN